MLPRSLESSLIGWSDLNSEAAKHRGKLVMESANHRARRTHSWFDSSNSLWLRFRVLMGNVVTVDFKNLNRCLS